VQFTNMMSHNKWLSTVIHVLFFATFVYFENVGERTQKCHIKMTRIIKKSSNERLYL